MYTHRCVWSNLDTGDQLCSTICSIGHKGICLIPFVSLTTEAPTTAIKLPLLKGEIVETFKLFFFQSCGICFKHPVPSLKYYMMWCEVSVNLIFILS